MHTSKKRTGGATLLAIASILIGFFLPNAVSAAYVELESTNGWYFDGGYWKIDIETSSIPQISGDLLNIRVDCTVNQKELCSGGGVSSWSSTITTGFSSTATTTNLASGIYYIAIATYKPTNTFTCTGRDCYYLEYYWDNDTKTPTLTYTYDQIGFNSVTNTRFTDIQLSGTSTVNINTEYYLDENEINTAVSAFNPTLVQFRYALNPSTTFSTIGESISNTTYGTSTVDTNLSGLSDGVYDLNVIFSNQGVAFGSDRPFPRSYIYTSFTISGGVLTATSTIEYYNALEPLDPEKYQPCSLTELSGCLSNSLLYLFYPSTEALTQFTDIYNTLSNKFPFAYFTDFNDSITSIYSNPDTNLSTVTVPFGSYGNITLISKAKLEAVPLSATIRTILGALIWLLLGATIYRRTQTIFNQTPQ